MNFFQRRKLNSLLKKARLLHDKRESGATVNVQQEIKINLELAKFYEKRRDAKKFPFSENNAYEYYRAAAILGDAKSQYVFAKREMELGKFWDQWAQGMYGLPIHQTYAKQHYQESFEYLQKAEALGSFLAKRLHGLAYISGWGVEKDQDKGFKLIVESIDEQNAWDKTTEIFKELGLNNPEFYSTMMAMRKKG